MLTLSAITNYQLTEIHYNSIEGNFTKRIIEPFALYSTNENWLLVAFCRLRKEFRVFRLDHIEQIVLLFEQFSTHEMTLQDYFERYILNVKTLVKKLY